MAGCTAEKEVRGGEQPVLQGSESHNMQLEFAEPPEAVSQRGDP